MADDFQYDVFISHSSKDKPTVRALAERLRADNLRVWLDDWELKPGDSIPAKIEEGLEHSRILLLCMSAHAFGSDWTTLESQTFRFRDPQNRERRFIPLRLDDAPLRGSLVQFLYIDWQAKGRKQAYTKLLGACRPPAKQPAADEEAVGEHVTEKALRLDAGMNYAYSFSADGKRALSGDTGSGIRIWDLSESFTEARATESDAPALPSLPEQALYTNAKVLLVGESGAGKTGLSKRLVGEEWEPSDSTVGAWATQWKLEVEAEGASSGRFGCGTLGGRPTSG